MIQLPNITEISVEDRESLERISHDQEFYAARRGNIAVSVDLKDAERVLRLVEKLAQAVKYQRRDRSGIQPDGGHWPR